jgi:hypothetical protein
MSACLTGSSRASGADGVGASARVQLAVGRDYVDRGEGAAVQIRRADLGALSDTHPRALRLQARLRGASGIDRFLAGRQIVVVFTVFFVARLSSCPTLDHIPLTQVGLPAATRPLLGVAIPGALFVLWFGQLVPQFVATRRALKLANSRLGSAACSSALALGSTGLAHLGFWIAGRLQGEPERIPSSRRSRWEQSATFPERFRLPPAAAG